MNIPRFLKLPTAYDLHDIDDVAVTLRHQAIIREKTFLRQLYTEFYARFRDCVPMAESQVLVELGSGGGFISDVMPDVITSDVLQLPTVDVNFSALSMPFGSDTVDGFFMVDVFHHLSEPRAFLREVTRCLRPGGRLVMIEPANTLWSRFIYRYLHHEPFDPSAGWGFESRTPLSSANSALAYIVFCRDQGVFERDFPSLKILALSVHTPLRYLLSGGVSLRQFVPGFAYPLVKGVEALLSPLNRCLGMFMTVELRKLG